ncbi:hypothetical protein IT401_00090 [Candidatus Nomurabacteria bacterium]|nr:hypothetical protein [Candidatus Nomurabacteria bacterium]
MKQPYLQQGFALLYTVMVVSLILTIAISISDISYKQGILSSLAKDSQAAFYEADAGVECAMYYDLTAGFFPVGTTVDMAPQVLPCAGRPHALSIAESSTDYFVYVPRTNFNTEPCFSMVINKLTEAPQTVIEGRGYNRCDQNVRQVERAVRVRY